MTWTPPTTGGVPTNYNVSINDSSNTRVPIPANGALQNTFTGLISDTLYTVSVVAINCAGTSSVMSASGRTCKCIDTSKEKHSLTRKLVGYRNWRQRWCKKEGNKVLRKDKNPIFSTSFGSVTFTRAKYRIFVSFTLFSKPCSPPFYTTFASNSYIPPTFSLENVFLYLFPLFFYYHFLYWQVPPLRFNYRHEQTPAFVWDHCKERGRIQTRRLFSSFVCTILNIRKWRHGNASI